MSAASRRPSHRRWTQGCRAGSLAEFFQGFPCPVDRAVDLELAFHRLVALVEQPAYGADEAQAAGLAGGEVVHDLGQLVEFAARVLPHRRDGVEVVGEL